MSLDEDTVLVAMIQDDGTVTIADKPVAGRRKRGTQPKVVTIALVDVWKHREDPAGVESVFDRILKRMPVADFAGTPEKVGYQAKVWLMRQLKEADR